jgi:hypothetical protein
LGNASNNVLEPQHPVFTLLEAHNDGCYLSKLAYDMQFSNNSKQKGHGVPYNIDFMGNMEEKKRTRFTEHCLHLHLEHVCNQTKRGSGNVELSRGKGLE